MKVEWAIVFATFMGPIFAVLTTIFLENHKATYKTKYDLFLILMRNRALPLSADHVSSLNTVQVIYKKHRAVLDAYIKLMEHLNTNPEQYDLARKQQYAWTTTKNEMLAKMLYQMAMVLKVNIEQLDLMNKAYLPTGWTEVERKTQVLQEYQYKIATGEAVTKIEIVNPSVNPLNDGTQHQLKVVKNG